MPPPVRPAVHRGLIVSGTSSGECLAWRIDSASASAAGELRGHKNDVKGMAVRGRTVASIAAGVAKVWRQSGGGWVCAADISCLGPICVALRLDAPPAGGVLLVGGADSVGVWSLAGGERQASLHHGEAVLSVCIDGNLVVTGCDDHLVRTWDLSRRVCTRTLQGHAECVFAVAVRGPLVVSGSIDESVRVWDLARRKEEGQQEARSVAVLQHNGMVHAGALGSTTVVSGTFESARSRVLVWEMP